MIVPIFNGISETVREFVHSFTNVGYVGPKGACKGELVQKVFRAFFDDFTKLALQGTRETSSDKIVPGKNASVKDQRKEGGKSWPRFY